jgi:hypothetical protein
MEVVVKLKTADRNPEIDDDDGTRALHIASPNMLTAVRAACRAAKASGLEPGGELSVTYTGDGELKGNNAPKLYSAVYQPPASSGNAVLAGSGNGGQPAAANDDPGPPKPPNVPPGKWAEMSVDQRYAVVAAMKAMADSGVAAEPIPF